MELAVDVIEMDDAISLFMLLVDKIMFFHFYILYSILLKRELFLLIVKA